jgi:RNA polymerase sigma-70 factor (ECF subfamily)
MKQQQPDDIARFQRLTSGDSTAFDELYEEYKTEIYVYSYKFLGNEADAEDATAQTFVKLWQQREDLADPNHILGLLFTIARNTCLDMLRKRKARHSLDKKAGALLYEQPASTDLEQMHAELIGHIYREAENLPKTTKIVFWLRYTEHKSPAEIATQLNLDRKTVYNHVQAARTLLRSALLKKGLDAAFFLFMASLPLIFY